MNPRDLANHVGTDRTCQEGEFPQTFAVSEIIDLGIGQPSPRLLPLELLQEAAIRRFGPEEDRLQLQYGSIPGFRGFRERLAALLSDRYRFAVSDTQLATTGGSSLAISLAAQMFAMRGQVVVCSDPTYFLVKEIFESLDLKVVGIPVDERGLRVDVLEHRIIRDGLRPAIVYCIPSFHNPCGVSLEASRARSLLNLAERFEFTIFADEPYVMLHWEDSPPPCMMSFDEGRGRVLSFGSFSKILGPGLRLGWVHAEPRLIEQFCRHSVLRSGGGLNPLVSSLVHGVIESGDLGLHVDKLRTIFANRSRYLAKALREKFSDVVIPDPKGGYFIWLKLPSGVDSIKLLERGREYGVGFTPGHRCAVDRELSQFVRLCFAFYEKEELVQGVQRLSALYHSVNSTILCHA